MKPPQKQEQISHTNMVITKMSLNHQMIIMMMMMTMVVIYLLRAMMVVF
uniref:Uncharacterized protein n=1 Tax=Triatoma infestans TaxID=30076 RepID=A0A161M492_TRIIF